MELKQLVRLIIIFGLAIQISAKLAGNQCHFPLSRAVNIATHKAVCQDKECKSDKDCDLAKDEECFCDAITRVSYARRILDLYADIEISRSARRMHLSGEKTRTIA